MVAILGGVMGAGARVEYTVADSAGESLGEAD